MLSLANTLTALRLMLAVPVAWLVVRHEWLGAFALFWVAVATDLLDGPIARRRGEASDIGGVFDHGTDAAFVTICATACYFAGQVPLLLAVLIPLAFLQYMLDSRVLKGHPLRTSRLGRVNGLGYFTVVGMAVGAPALGLQVAFEPLTWGLAWLLICSTLASMTERGLLFSRLIKEGGS